MMYDSGVVTIRRACQRMLPARERRVVSTLLQKILGSHWKALYFGDIEKTSLKDTTRGRHFDAGLKLAPFFISKPGTVFDIGANAGRYTYVLSKAVGPRNTYAVEPVRQLAQRLTRLFPDVNVLNMALSEATGELDLRIPVVDHEPFWGRGTLEEFHFVEPGQTGEILERVDVRTLDELCEKLNIQDVRFVKIDVEGHEWSVLRGAAETLARWHPVLLVEVEQRHHAGPIDGVMEWIKGHGYAGFFYDARQMELRPLDCLSLAGNQLLDNRTDAEYVNNFYFVESRTAREVIDSVCRVIRQGAC